jgi:hypothetical protein
VAGSVRIEKAGKPVVFVVADRFLEDARSSAEDNGMPSLAMVTVPVDEYYKSRISLSAVRPVAVGIFDDLIDKLLLPLRAGEAVSSKESKAGKSVLINGPNYEAVLEKFNQLCLDNHWGTGLPLLPPTAERVGWMLTGTDRSPDEEIGVVAPKNGVATIGKIAINAVMAGARPEYLPVIIAAMEAVTDPKYDLLHVMTSTGSFTLYILVTGPITDEIGLNSGIGFLGYGWRANSTIGHAIRLCLINLGHLWPGENDMALVGRPSPHTFHVLAENAHASPWAPYHVSAGYEASESCVTVSSSMGSSLLGGGAVEPWSVESILANMIAAIQRCRRHVTVWRLGTAVPSPPRYTFILHPEFAVELNKEGFKRESLGEYLYARSAIRFEELTPEEISAFRRRIVEGEIPFDRASVFEAALRPGQKVPLLLSPRDCHFIIAGGVPGYSFEMSYFSIPPYRSTAVMTKKIDSAALPARDLEFGVLRHGGFD